MNNVSTNLALRCGPASDGFAAMRAGGRGADEERDGDKQTAGLVTNINLDQWRPLAQAVARQASP